MSRHGVSARHTPGAGCRATAVAGRPPVPPSAAGRASESKHAGQASFAQPPHLHHLSVHGDVGLSHGLKGVIEAGVELPAKGCREGHAGHKAVGALEPRCDGAPGWQRSWPAPPWCVPRPPAPPATPNPPRVVPGDAEDGDAKADGRLVLPEGARERGRTADGERLRGGAAGSGGAPANTSTSTGTQNPRQAPLT